MIDSHARAAWIAGFLFAASCSSTAQRDPAAPEELDLYDVVWNSPSRDASGSMPIGNGEVGLNVWVEAGGDLLFYISRTDSWSEASRLLKLGRIRLHLEPNPFVAGEAFEQRLALRDGRIEIRAGGEAGKIAIEIFVESDSDVIHISGTSERPVRVRAALECWRNELRRLLGKELESSWTMREAPDSIEVVEAADIDVDQAGAVVWYHRNERSIRPLTLAHQGLESVASLAIDPLLQRTFGGWMAGTDFAKSGARVLVLYLTTHGSDKHELAVKFWPLKLDDITPAALKIMLDDAGIKWRVLIISACYSGGYIEPLKDDNTLVMTASDATRTSFGCGSESDFTYFGRALFDDELRRSHSFAEAFGRARVSIAEREKKMGHEYSNPQIAIGAAIAEKLKRIEARLADSDQMPGKR